MGKLIGAAALVMLTGGAHVLPAQTLGIKLGGTFSNFVITPEPLTTSQQTLASAGGGPFIHLGHGPIGLQLELMAVTKGSKIESPGDTTKIKINYVELPVTLLLKAKQGPYVFAGPAVSIELSCQTQFQTPTLRVTSNCNGLNSDVFERNKVDYGIVAGGGVHRTFGRRTIFLEGRYDLGMRNIHKEDGMEIKNRAVSVYLGFMSRVPARP